MRRPRAIAHAPPAAAAAPLRRWWALCACALWLSGASPALAWDTRDRLVCAVEDGEVSCDVDVRRFLGTEIREVLNNGWENVLRFRLLLFDADEEVVAVSYAELNERCYIDPFDDPCLALWTGAEAWQRFVDVDAMINGIGHFRLRSVGIDQLEPGGTYHARLQVQLNPITDEQINLVRSWLARNRGGHLVVGHGDSSVFGTFVSVFSNIRPGDAEATLSLDSGPIPVAPAQGPPAPDDLLAPGDDAGGGDGDPQAPDDEAPPGDDPDAAPGSGTPG